MPLCCGPPVIWISTWTTSVSRMPKRSAFREPDFSSASAGSCVVKRSNDETRSPSTHRHADRRQLSLDHDDSAQQHHARNVHGVSEHLLQPAGFVQGGTRVH